MCLIDTRLPIKCAFSSTQYVCTLCASHSILDSVWRSLFLIVNLSKMVSSNTTKILSQCHNLCGCLFQVIVHLFDDTTAVASLLYLQKHYEFALYEVVVNKPVQLSTFNDNVHSGQDVFRLGRDESLDLRITHGRVEYMIPVPYERCHYMYFSNNEHSVRIMI